MTIPDDGRAARAFSHDGTRLFLFVTDSHLFVARAKVVSTTPLVFDGLDGSRPSSASIVR